MQGKDVLPVQERFSRASRNKKRRLYILLGSVIAAAVVIIIFTTTSSPEEEPAWNFGELSKFELEEVEELVLRNGGAGSEVSVNDPELIKEFSALLEPLTFKHVGDGELKPEKGYTAEFYFSETANLGMVFDGSSVEVTSSGGKPLLIEEFQGGKYSLSEDITSELDTFLQEALANREVEEKEEPAKVEVEEKEPAISVVINNDPAARPSSGLQEADFIYEFLVEGGHTRYLAVYREYHDENFEIGPIRSLRPYFAFQSLDHGGIIAHSGYSARTREMIQGLGLFQIADHGDNFWRDASRRRPHNLYTSIDKLYDISADELQVEEHTYSLEPSGEERNYEEEHFIEIDYSPINRVSYSYDEEQEVYFRYINEQPHTDRETGEQYYADRLIIRKTPHRNVPGTDLVDIDLSGSGDGRLYEKGRRYDITWERDGSETVYRYMDGTEVDPIPGTTWVQVVR